MHSGSSFFYRQRRVINQERCLCFESLSEANLAGMAWPLYPMTLERFFESKNTRGKHYRKDMVITPAVI